MQLTVDLATSLFAIGHLDQDGEHVSELLHARAQIAPELLEQTIAWIDHVAPPGSSSNRLTKAAKRLACDFKPCAEVRVWAVDGVPPIPSSSKHDTATGRSSTESKAATARTVPFVRLLNAIMFT